MALTQAEAAEFGLMDLPPDVPWVTTGPEPHLATCTGCGATIPRPVFPVTISAWCADMAIVLSEHANCGPVRP